MLIHAWDAALDPIECQEWLAGTNRFGVLAVNNLDSAHTPILVPTDFTMAEEELLIHLARPNQVWPHLEATAEVLRHVFGDYAYISSYWRTKAGRPVENGVPTSGYAAAQLKGRRPRTTEWTGAPSALRRIADAVQPVHHPSTEGVDA